MQKNMCYHNDMNLIPLQNFNTNEMNILFAICSKMKDEGLNIINMDFSEIKHLCNYRKNNTIEEFGKEIESVYKKLLSITCSFKEEEKLIGFVLFTRYVIDLKKQTAEVKLNEDFTYFLNKITGNFTKLELLEFSSFISTYTKTAYRFLKQYRKQGFLVMNIEDFRERFCVPESYQMCNIDNRILKPIKEELSSIFKDLEIRKIKAKKGKKIVRIEFHFIPEDDMLENGKYRIRKGKKYVEKNVLDLDEEEIIKIFPSLPKSLSENLDHNLDSDLEKFLLERRKLKEKNQEVEKIQCQVEFDV